MMRGELWWADFGIPFGSEPGFRRPVLIVQDDSFNKSNIHTTIVIPLTTNLELRQAPGNVFAQRKEAGLSRDSVVVVSQIGVIDKKRLVEKIRKPDRALFDEVLSGLLLILGIE